MSHFEQRANIKFMFKLGKSASETLTALQKIYGDTALKKSAVYDWFSQFKNGQETLEDDQRSERPSTSKAEEMVGKVRQLIRCDRRMTIEELEQEVGTVTGHFYMQVLQRLRDAVRRKGRDEWQGQWFVHHDNAPSHTSLVVQQFLAEKFATMEDMKSNATAELRKIPKETFHRCFQRCQDRWRKCVCAQGPYFEGD
ncbi:hypothetical protein B7P43_G17619 [Cryptotermes secundus]|uniref:Mos1 transposase HTH domain-containing protein n=1 Tax=Cryptotermes secundus TaxID=105785 RepID=A0A2J7R031_9NEOP|nr:hypothetical protein B7P43_G17619 [Cryptotermes secundus]